MISLVADRSTLEKVIQGEIDPFKELSETDSQRQAREHFENETEKEKQMLLKKEKDRHIRLSRKFVEDEKKWEENVIKKIDLLPPDPETHFNGCSVKPGFQFWLSLCSAPKQLLTKLDINIPEMIYVNYNAYMVSCPDLEKSFPRQRIKIEIS